MESKEDLARRLINSLEPPYGWSFIESDGYVVVNPGNLPIEKEYRFEEVDGQTIPEYFLSHVGEPGTVYRFKSRSIFANDDKSTWRYDVTLSRSAFESFKKWVKDG